jgi:hypothetical protein
LLQVPSLRVQVPQLHSHDYRVRIKTEALHSILFSHLTTLQDPDVMADAALLFRSLCLAGTTDWQATVDGMAVSLEWDWIQLEDGVVMPFRSVAPRTNLCLVGPKGYDLSEEEHQDGLWALVDVLAWEQAVAREIPRLRGGH